MSCRGGCADERGSRDRAADRRAVARHAAAARARRRRGAARIRAPVHRLPRVAAAEVRHAVVPPARQHLRGRDRRRRSTTTASPRCSTSSSRLQADWQVAADGAAEAIAGLAAQRRDRHADGDAAQASRDPPRASRRARLPLPAAHHRNRERPGDPAVARRASAPGRLRRRHPAQPRLGARDGRRRPPLPSDGACGNAQAAAAAARRHRDRRKAGPTPAQRSPPRWGWRARRSARCRRR